jgi:hypothetical protein
LVILSALKNGTDDGTSGSHNRKDGCQDRSQSEKMDTNQAKTGVNLKEVKEEIKSGQAEMKSKFLL